MNPPIGTETTFPVTRLDHFYAANPDKIPAPVQADQDIVVIMLKSELTISDRSGKSYTVPAGSSCYIPSTLVSSTSLTVPSTRSEGEGLYFNLAATSTGERPLIVFSDASRIPLYEDDDLQERRYLGRWAAMETGDACSISIINYKKKGSFRPEISGKTSFILVLDGWIRSEDGLVMQNQIYFPEHSVTVEVSKGTRFLLVTGSRRPYERK